MGRGILSGLFWGSLISVVILVAVSQLAPLEAPGDLDTASAVPGEGESGQVSPLMESPEAESTPEPAADPAGAVMGTETAAPASEPASAVEVPAGSEFRKAPPETEAELPASASAPPANQAPAAPTAATEDSVATISADGAPRPATPGMSVSAPVAPETDAESAAAVTSAPAQEAPETSSEPALPGGDDGEAAPDARLSKGFPPPQRPATVTITETASAVTATESATTAATETATESAAPVVSTVTPSAGGFGASADTVQGEAATETAALAPSQSETLGKSTEAATEVAPSEQPPEVTTAAPRPAPGTADAVPADQAEPAGADERITGNETAALPQTGLGKRVQPLTERRAGSSSLPQIGAGTTEEAEPEPEPEAEPELPEADRLTMDALTRNARPFENPEGKPLFSVILIDVGSAGLDRSVLTTFGFPVTFAIDPTREDAQEAAQRYTDAGFEVVALATGMPEGATARDVETTLGSHLAQFPQAIAVMDPAENGIADHRELVEQALMMASQDGHGLIGWSRGLGPLESAARKGDAPVGLVYRALDEEGERSEVIRRYLDRAAFKAAQDGSVIMVGHSRPETVTALFEWALSSKSGQVALAPLSAILRQ